MVRITNYSTAPVYLPVEGTEEHNVRREVVSPEGIITYQLVKEKQPGSSEIVEIPGKSTKDNHEYPYVDVPNEKFKRMERGLELIQANKAGSPIKTQKLP